MNSRKSNEVFMVKLPKKVKVLEEMGWVEKNLQPI